jgi:hypothetical protein
MPTTKNNLPVIARVRATRKGKTLQTPSSGELGGRGIRGNRFYEIIVVGGVTVPERLSCSCPAHRFGRAKLVQETGLCKHIFKAVEELARNPELRRSEKDDVIVYAPATLRALAVSR